MYPHIYAINPATRPYRKITEQSTLCTSLTDSAQLRTLFADHAPLSASSIISQQYCKLQSSHKCHLSRQWWHMATSHDLLCLETPPFCWRLFCRSMINRLSHAFPWTWNFFFFYKWHPDSEDLLSFAMFFSANFRETCVVSFAHAQSTSKSKSA